MFRTMKLRGKRKDCVVCGDNPTIKALIDYVQFCGAGANDKVDNDMEKDISSIYLETIGAFTLCS